MIKIKAYGICLYQRYNNSMKILLCKSILSKHRWGFLKGVSEVAETPEQTAQREFFEESGINIPSKYFQKYFEQQNETKDIGIYLVDVDKLHSIYSISSFFEGDKLKDIYLSKENQEVRFFDINSLPLIKKKQLKLVEDIVSFLKRELIS